MNSKMMVSGSLIALLCGCQKSDFATAPVTGVVLCEGKPVANAIVFFQPVSTANSTSKIVGKQGFSYTDDQGRFSIGTYDTDDGAVVGKHSVRVAAGPAGTKCDCMLGDEIPVMDYEVRGGETNEVEVVLKKKIAAQNQSQMLAPEGVDD